MPNDSCSTIKGFLKYLWNISEDWNYIPLPTSFILFIIIKPSSSTMSGIPGTIKFSSCFSLYMSYYLAFGYSYPTFVFVIFVMTWPIQKHPDLFLQDFWFYSFEKFRTKILTALLFPCWYNFLIFPCEKFLILRT